MSDRSSAAIPAAPVRLVAGDAMPAFRSAPLTRTDFVRYAGAGGDFNPLHHDEQAARDAGHPTVFAMGMLHAGMLGLRLARWVGPEQIRSFAVRFTGQVWPGDELSFSGSVERVLAGEDVPVAEIVLAIERQTGEQVVRATATAVVAPVLAPQVDATQI